MAYPNSPIDDDDYGQTRWHLVREKRAFIPDWMWRIVAPIADTYPLVWMLTKKTRDEE
jgi:hypothetical protein